tara:strand:- start:2532 stop:4328 length:1797 start_codon:yes stop_codon:yes gene_type:complete
VNVSYEVLAPKIKRLSTALFSLLLKPLRYAVKHPFRTVIFIAKAYILLMLFAFFLAFSVGSFAQTAPLNCELGETPLPGLGGCGSPAADQGCKIKAINGRSNSGTVIYTGSKVPEYTSALSALDKQTTGGTDCPWSYTDTNSHNFDYSCASAAAGTTAVNVPYTVTITRSGFTSSLNQLTNSCVDQQVNVTNPVNFNMFVQIEWSEEYVCPDNHPLGPVNYDDGTLIGKYCYRVPEPVPCDCSQLNGEGSYTSQSFIADKDVYTQENPPQCLNINDSFDSSIPACNCQIVATKWFSQLVNVGGVEKTRWQPLPTPEQNGQSGIFTGAACGEEETTTPPSEKEDCVTMKNGTKLCVANKAEKCITLDGVQQCESGCGTVNGEFMCTEGDTIDDDDEDLPDPDDNIDDPDKTHDDMTKQDFKDVNKGIETRLDLLAKLMEQNNNKVSSGGASNGAKIDSTNRLLGEINGKLGELVAQGEGDGDGDGDGGEDSNPQPEYSTEALEEFVNPNDWENRNFGTVLQAATERMQQAPVFTAVESFFDVSITGSCPAWQTSVSLFGTSLDINIDQFCSPEMADIWPIIRAVLLLVFSYYAFREAVL